MRVCVWVFVRKKKRRTAKDLYTNIAYRLISHMHVNWLFKKTFLLSSKAHFNLYTVEHVIPRMNRNTARGNRQSVCFTTGNNSTRTDTRDSIIFCLNDRLSRNTFTLCSASGFSWGRSQVAASSAAQLDAHFLL